MAKLSIKPDSADVTQYIFIQASNKNEGRTGLLYNTSGLKCYYLRPLGSATVVPLVTQTVTGAHADGGFVQVDATNMPGVYRLDFPDAICAAGVRSAIVQLSGASNMTPLPMEIDLNTQVNVTHVNATTQTAGDIPAELAKVPKSDSNVSWNATALGAIDTTLTATHGTGSWESASAGAGTADINTALSASHGAGSWVEASPSAIAIGTAVWEHATRTITGGTADVQSISATGITAIANGMAISNGTCGISAAGWVALGTTEPAAVDVLNGCLLTIVDGTGKGQARLITDWLGSTNNYIATVDWPWAVIPDGTSLYRIYPFSGILLADTGVCMAAGTTTITLSITASNVADTYVGHTIYIGAGAGYGQARLITAYTADRIATVSPAWTTDLSAYPATDTSIYKIMPVGRVYVDQVAATATEIITDGVWTSTPRTITGGTANLVTAVTNGVTLANDAITAAAIAIGAIDADALATDAVTEIQSGLAMGTATTAILGYVDDLETRLTATRAGYLDNLSAGVVPTAAAIADAVHDEVVEGTLTLRQIERIQLAALAGESSGGGTGTLTFSDVAGTAARITATVDSTGNRTAITLDGA